MPLAILLGTEAPSGQLTSRATQFLPLSFMPRAAGLVHLGDLGPFPFQHGQGSGYRCKSPRDLGSALSLPPATSLGLSFPLYHWRGFP